MISRKKLFLLSLLSGILFFLSWPPMGVPVILFFAFVPLLQIEHAISSNQTPAKKTSLFWFSYLTFFIWNISTTWWVYNASLGGAAMAILANSLLMAMVFWIFHLAKSRLLKSGWELQTANLLFPVFWIAFEFFHHRWELTWPWLTLGNAFAKNHTWIQWYEYTGVPGGSLWALALNLLFFEWLRNSQPPATSRQKRSIIIVGVISIPLIISYLIYYSYQEKANPVTIVVVQPNIDPYSEKFSGMNYKEQLDKMLELAKQKVDSTADYLVFPETALTEEIWENNLEQTSSVHILKEFLKPFPKLKIVVGASTYYLYEEGEKLSATAREFKQQDGYYEVYNTALLIDNSGKIQIYHKSKLVPGVERMPYPAVFGFLDELAISLGGTSGSLGTQDERTVFSGKEGIAPVVCYESIYGEYVSDYINNGAHLIFVITNDGWWLDTPGYRQHLLYGRLRAIETRRCIARSANTGISCFIDERGEFSQETEWWKPAVIQANINSNSEKTFYTKYGDIIGRVCFYVSGIVLLFAITMWIRLLRSKKN